MVWKYAKNKDKCLLYDKEIDLTPIEFDILLYLASKKERSLVQKNYLKKYGKKNI